jgi:hypothetical protein
MESNLLIVGDYNRKDFLYAAEVLHRHFKIYFIEFLDKSEIKSFSYSKWGKEIFWKDYKDAVDLLEKLKPQKVLFYFIESLNHVALNVACKYLRIRTYHIEHGVRNYSYQNKNKKIDNKTGKPLLFDVFKKLKNSQNRIKNRRFFLNTIKKLPNEQAVFLRNYFKIRTSHSIWETFHRLNHPLRIADSYISFSPKIFEFHKIIDHLPEDYPVFFIGCPSFDYFADLANLYQEGEDIVFIDQAFEQWQLFGWNQVTKELFLARLEKFSREHNRKLWIKKHPVSNDSVFESFNDNEGVEMISDNETFKMAIQRSKIILGFFSTLLMPFMAMDHTVCFSLEMHPVQPEDSLSSFLTETGAVNSISSWEKLSTSFDNLGEIYFEQKRKKEKFIEDWMYKFDGKSSERLRKVLIGDEAV